MITIDQRDAWLVTICTVRYALGRQSYVVGEACDLARRMRPHLYEWQVAQIAREVQQCLDDGRAGMSCDVAAWTRLVADLTPHPPTEEPKR